jgi:hypothetical protein
MDNLIEPSAKLLYLINEMHSLKMITSIEKAQLKGNKQTLFYTIQF